MSTDLLLRAADLITNADGLVIAAGAGMGVDSGLPDFRGEDGFWQHYPALAKAQLSFNTIATPSAFRRIPQLAWGFYGHRLHLYRETAPHRGYNILRSWGEHMTQGYFVVTSNVDGHFQKGGFLHQRINEIHGSIHHLQCLQGCTKAVFSAENFSPIVDSNSCLLTNAVPRCPHCKGIARPNILMFADDGWTQAKSQIQSALFRHWYKKLSRPVIVEIGAGSDIPTIRMFTYQTGAPVIRINPMEPDVPNSCDVPLAIGALKALEQIDELIGSVQPLLNRRKL